MDSNVILEQGKNKVLFRPASPVSKLIPALVTLGLPSNSPSSECECRQMFVSFVTVLPCDW